MFSIETSIFISAEPQTIWTTLLQVDHWPRWNTYVTGIEIQAPHKQLGVGSKQVIQLTPDGHKPDQTESYTNVVTKMRQNKEFVWEGVLVSGIIFKTVHWCRLERPMAASDSGTNTQQTVFVQGERFSGLLAPLVCLTGKLNVLRKGYERMNIDLRDYIEKPS